jgi:hypothetical protein
VRLDFYKNSAILTLMENKEAVIFIEEHRHLVERYMKTAGSFELDYLRCLPLECLEDLLHPYDTD